MKTDKEKIIARFQEVKALGYVTSHRSNNTGIGKTFEDYIGVVENNLNEPDLFGFEIKSHRQQAESYTTLFTKSPDFPPRGNDYLRTHFGTVDAQDSALITLRTSLFADHFNTFQGLYSFRIINDRVAKEIRVGVYSLGGDELLDESVGYTYETLERALHQKLKNLFYVSADTRRENDVESFWFNHAEIYTEPSFERFLALLDAGLIMLDLRIGAYRTGPSKGKLHDHGTGFRIKPVDLKDLYQDFETIQ